MALPSAASFTGGAVTEGGFKTAVTDLRNYLATLFGTAGTPAEALSTLGAVLNSLSAKTAAYTVISSDRGKVIDATSGTWTLTLTAAATLGDGFAFAVRNSGTGVVTIDPNGSELIDGAATLALAAGESCLCICTGAAWKTVSRQVLQVAITSAAIEAVLTSGNVTTALGYIRRPLDLLRMWHVKIEAWILEQVGIKFVPVQAGLHVVRLP